MRGVGDPGCNDQFLGLNLGIRARLGFEVPALTAFESRDFLHISLKFDQFQKAGSFCISLVVLVHCFTRGMLSFKDAEAIVEWKVGKVDATTEVVRLETRIEVFCRPNTSNGFVLRTSLSTKTRSPG